jgi:hypothetical protein
VSDLFKTIEEFDVQPDEFWSAMSYLTELGQANEVGLLVPGLGLETFLDFRTDAAERKAGIEGGTPRTIEGPLYIAGAPLSKGEARLDDGSEVGEVLFMDGEVRDIHGKPVAGPLSTSGTPTPSAAIPSSTRPSQNTISAAVSRPMPRAATASGPSYPQATPARLRVRRRSCSTSWAGTGGARRTSTSSSPHRAIEN